MAVSFTLISILFDFDNILIMLVDNLTQDQMVIQTIRLMDQLFKRVNLDLQLTPYAILSTSLTDGALSNQVGVSNRVVTRSRNFAPTAKILTQKVTSPHIACLKLKY